MVQIRTLRGQRVCWVQDGPHGPRVCYPLPLGDRASLEAMTGYQLSPDEYRSLRAAIVVAVLDAWVDDDVLSPFPSWVMPGQSPS